MYVEEKYNMCTYTKNIAYAMSNIFGIHVSTRSLPYEHSCEVWYKVHSVIKDKMRFTAFLIKSYIEQKRIFQNLL